MTTIQLHDCSDALVVDYFYSCLDKTTTVQIGDNEQLWVYKRSRYVGTNAAKGGYAIGKAVMYFQSDVQEHHLALRAHSATPVLLFQCQDRYSRRRSDGSRRISRRSQVYGVTTSHLCQVHCGKRHHGGRPRRASAFGTVQKADCRHGGKFLGANFRHRATCRTANGIVCGKRHSGHGRYQALAQMAPHTDGNKIPDTYAIFAYICQQFI